MVRVKYRYFLVEIVFADQRWRQRNMTSEKVYCSVWEAVKQSYGDYGVGALRSSCVVKYLNKETNMAIIRARRDFYRMAQVAFTFVKKIGEHDCFLHTLHIGGTVRACQKFLIRYHRRHLPVLYKKSKTQEQREGMRQALLSACVNMEHFSTKTENKERSVSEIAGEDG